MRDFFPELWEKITLNLSHVFQIPGSLDFALLVEKCVYQSSLTDDSIAQALCIDRGKDLLSSPKVFTL